jgi:hypothetical protein
LHSKNWFLFRGRYDYKFIHHLVIVTYCTGSFTSVSGASNHKREKLGQCLECLPWYVSSFILYLHITTRSYGVSKIDHLEWMEVLLIFIFCRCAFKCYFLFMFYSEEKTQQSAGNFWGGCWSAPKPVKRKLFWN